MKKLGFGCMRLPLIDPKDQKSIDFDAVCSLFDEFLRRGFTYFDTAYFYHQNTSEKCVKRCLVDRYPRESFCLATKLPVGIIESPEKMAEIFSGQKRDCGVEYFDYYLLHNMNDENWAKAKKLDAIGFTSEKKALGEIRHLGFSFHGDDKLLEEILTAWPQADFVQLQLNYLDWEDKDVLSHRCYDVARAHGKDIIVMEPCKGGELSVVPEEAEKLMSEVCPGSKPSSWAFRYVAGLDGVFMVLSGMNAAEQVIENTDTFDACAPLSEREMAVIRCTVDLIHEYDTIKCTGCRYCEAGCPQKIPIPDCFSLYNRFMRTHMERLSTSYGWTVEDRGRASDCISCRACVSKCPQSLEIPSLLKKVVEVFE